MTRLIRCILILFLLNVNLETFAQVAVNWDDKSKSSWPNETRLIEVNSSIDHKSQKAYIYKSQSNEPKPLIISLHTWGGNYAQRDPLLKYCIEKDINYIHPDFRGPNNNPEAGGSELVIQDIDDAIQWALDSLSVNSQEIHLVGVSGGAFATLASYMKSKHKINSYHAFVGIYNLENWYYESLGRNNSYAKDITALTNGKNGIPNFDEARKRSPLLMSTPIEQRKDSKINLYVGLHDGYVGSVPISHSLEMYNKIVKDFSQKKTPKSTDLIPIEDSYELLKRRTSSNFNPIPAAFMGRDIIYQKKHKDIVEIIVFDGGHEMPESNLLDRIFD